MPEFSNALFTGCRVKPGMTMGMMSVHRWTPFWNAYLDQPQAGADIDRTIESGWHGAGRTRSSASAAQEPNLGRKCNAGFDSEKYLIWYISTPTMAAVIVVVLLLTIQIMIQPIASTYGMQDRLIDPFMADGNTMFLIQPAADLFRTSHLTGHDVNFCVGHGRDARHYLSSWYCKTIPSIRCVTLTTQATIMCHLAADHGFIHTDNPGNLCLVLFSFQ
jgi:hypothetical protein